MHKQCVPILYAIIFMHTGGNARFKEPSAHEFYLVHAHCLLSGIADTS